MTERPTFIEFLSDPLHLGAHPAFQDLEPWAAWLDFARVAYGLPLDAEAEKRVLKATGWPRYKTWNFW